MDRALFGTAIAFPASLYCFTDLILHNRVLQVPQQGLCVVEEKAQILGIELVLRTAKSTDITPLGFSIVRRRLDKNTYIHGGSRLVPKPYHTTSTTRFCPLPGVGAGVFFGMLSHLAGDAISYSGNGKRWTTGGCGVAFWHPFSRRRYGIRIVQVDSLLENYIIQPLAYVVALAVFGLVLSI